MRIRIDPELHQDFLASCRGQDKPAAQVLREFMREYVLRFPSEKQHELFVAEPKAEYKKR